MPSYTRESSGIILGSTPYVSESFDSNCQSSIITTGTWGENAPIKGGYSSCAGETIANFAKRKKSGELLPFTNWEQFFLNINSVGGSFHSEIKSDLGCGSTTTTSYPGFPAGGSMPPYMLEKADFEKHLGVALRSDLINAAAAKIYARGHDSLTMLVELRKTAKMFGDLVRRAGSLSLPKIRDTWLEARYGWRPLIYDMISLSETIQNLESKRTRFTERVGTSINKTEDKEHVFTSVNLDWTYRYIDKIQISSRGVVSADIQPPNFQFNPAITGWELIKFSFIIDWFINVGSWLETLSFLVYEEKSVGAYGCKIDITRSGVLIVDRYNPSRYENLTLTFESDVSGSLVKRIPGSVNTNFPSIGANLSIPKLLDLVAIFTR